MRVVSLLLVFMMPLSWCYEFSNTTSTRKLGQLKGNKKLIRSSKLIQAIQSTVKIPKNFKPMDGSPKHNPKGPAVCAIAMGPFNKLEAEMFVGSLRETGYKDDIVIAVSPDNTANFLAVLKKYNVITYMVDLNCEDTNNEGKCVFSSKKFANEFSVNMIRYYIYQWWALQYDTNTLMMVSDFKDVFFQSNPFLYHTEEWAPPLSQLVMFQEPYPNKSIRRCVFNGGWVESCYGKEGLDRIGSNIVSCSGVTMGIRDGILGYAYLITQQLDPKVRYNDPHTNADNKQCNSLGMDQGFHNWLLYSGQLSRFYDVKIFPQGEGPVNTIGGFFGARIILKFPLTQWQVLRGEKGSQKIYNWNGEPSPCIHQGDRFLNTDFEHDYSNLAVGKRANQLANAA